MLSSGTKLGPYEIVAPLGAGGMGEVYRAKDTRLERTVAVKILPAAFTSDPASRQRFEREAKTISSLNHPNICVLYDVGHQHGVDYLVMEYLEGETLDKRLEKGPLPLEQALRYATQIAEALDKANRMGIVHRDLKPGNVMLTATGAKLLDFGLAKESSPLATLATVSVVSPQNSPVTQEGTVLGTFQYMSPEQIEGKPLDGRSDVFSLGAVLYEMLTSKRAFEGKTQLSVASAILEREPMPLDKVQPLTPASLKHAVDRCLAKDPDERWQTSRDLAMELKWIGQNARAAAGMLPPEEGRKTPAWLLPWLVSGILALALLAALFLWMNEKPAPDQTMFFSAPLNFAARDMAIAPNGQLVAVVGYRESARKSGIWIYEVGAPEGKLLAGTEGANFPFWSPDGKSVGFFADGKLKRLDVAGGPVQTLCDAPSGRGGTWNKDGVILFTPSGQLTDGLHRVSAMGGVPERMKVGDGIPPRTSQRWPMFLPDGRHYLFLAATVGNPQETDGIYAGQLDSTETHFLVRTSSNAAYAKPGYLVFVRDKTLLAQRFDGKALKLSGEPFAVFSEPQYLPRILRALFAVSDNGVLLARKSGDIALSQLLWLDRNGKEVGAVGDPDVFSNVMISTSGQAVAVDKTDPGNQNTDIWSYDFRSGASRRLTFDPALDAVPVWNFDGTRIVFASNRQSVFDLYMKNADGAVEEKLIYHTGDDKYPNGWTRDGKYVLYEQGPELWLLAVEEGTGKLFLKGPATLKNGQFSPDGKWVAYASNETGKWEIYVTSFPETRGKWQVSNGGGEQPRWRGDGKELFYLSPEAKIMAVRVKLGSGVDAGAPVALFQADPREVAATSEQFVYDVDPSGQRFLINTQAKKTHDQPISVILNWAPGRKQ